MRYEGRLTIITPLTKEIVSKSNYKNWFLDPKITFYNTHGRLVFKEEDISSFIEKANDDHTITWAMLRKYDKYHIGNIALQSINFIDKTAELAILIGETEIWGKGYGTDACELVLKHAFEKLNLNRIYLGTIEPNIGMRKVAEKLNMALEGKSMEAFWFNGKYVPIYHYAILRKEWKEYREK